ncbi:MAG TPA: hypothetical protein VJ693_15100 [Ideonella sp.]|nr:hypothetical protein [Ideonella sp.]
MNRSDIDLVFGRGRLRMVTGHHVEVFREESRPGERRRYSKRFLATDAGDLRHWTEREERILTRLVGLGIAPAPRVEPFDRGEEGRLELLRTYDAGVTVDHWVTLLPVQRDGTPLRHVFEDCAHWWALARHCLMALDAIHELGLVHLDLKADNICIPVGPADFDPAVPGAVMTPCFEQLALIDFAFSLFPGEGLSQPLPIAGQVEYAYQSPRLLSALEAGREGDLAPTLQLDWRCDVFSLAAMLRRYLPGPEAPLERSWTPWHLEQAHTLNRRLLEAHDADAPVQRPHRVLIALTKEALADAALSASLKRGWVLAADGAPPSSDLATPLTRIAMPARASSPHAEPEPAVRPRSAAARAPARRAGRVREWITAAAVGTPLLGAVWWSLQPWPAGERSADAALAAPAAAASAVPLLPVPTAAPARALPPAPAPAPAPVAATQPAPAPVESESAAAPPTAPGAASTNAATRGRTAASSPISLATAARQMPVNQTERERALEWLDRRGPSPRPGMTLPPAPSTAPASAAGPLAIDEAERERALEWLTRRGPSPRTPD